MEIANGVEPDGITFRCHLVVPNWIVTIRHPDGRQLSESYHWAFEPRFGPDVLDVSRAEELMDKLITKIRQPV